MKDRGFAPILFFGLNYNPCLPLALPWPSPSPPGDSRVSREHDDESLRDVKLAANTVDNWADYDTEVGILKSLKENQ